MRKHIDKAYLIFIIRDMLYWSGVGDVRLSQRTSIRYRNRTWEYREGYKSATWVDAKYLNKPRLCWILEQLTAVIVRRSK